MGGEVKIVWHGPEKIFVGNERKLQSVKEER